MGADVVFGNRRPIWRPLVTEGPMRPLQPVMVLPLHARRVIGVSVDVAGARRSAWRCRRASNTSGESGDKYRYLHGVQALLAIMAGLFAMHHGPQAGDR